MQVEKEGIHALSQSDEEETDIQELLVDDDGEEGGEWKAEKLWGGIP